jgi:hypothetical protein
MMKKMITMTQDMAVNVWKLSAISVFILGVLSCAEVEEGDGYKADAVTLPTDSALSLYCEDVGIADNSCILDDPKNPYVISVVNDDTKWDLHNAAPSEKSRFYLWATAQARSPRGENQYYTALALHHVYSESDDESIGEQAKKAYRSILDNYFNSVTFWTYSGTPYPVPLRKLAGQNIYDPPIAGLDHFFSLDAATNQLKAKELFGQWGYTWDSSVEEFSKNY